jgi:hypothetical protein
MIVRNIRGHTVNMKSPDTLNDLSVAKKIGPYSSQIIGNKLYCL